MHVGIWCLLATLDTQDDLTHDLEFLPVDAGLVLADERLVPFLCRDEIASVQWEEGNPF